MNFINPAVLWALPAAVLCCLMYWLYGDSVRKKLLKSFAGGNNQTVLSGEKRFVRRSFFLLAITFFTLAAARPYWGERPLEFNLAQTDALIVFDVSKSMLAEDVAPSRLEHGKWLLRKLIADNPQTAFGIAAFAGRAFLTCPVTGDRVSLEQCIDELDCNLVPVGGTNLAEALNVAVKSLKAAGGTTREIILITDGEELSGSIEKELSEVKKANIRLFVVGLGDPAVPALIRIRGEDNQKHFMRDRSGALVRTKLNEDLLKKLAVATNGVYINSSNLNTGLEVLNRELSKLPHNEKKAVRRSLPIERFMLFLVPGVFFLLLYMIIDEVDKRKLHTLFRLCLLIGLPGCWGSGALFAEDLPAKETAAVAAEKNPTELYNQARKFQLENKSTEAAAIYEELLSMPLSDELKHKVLHNLGVSNQTAGRMKFAQAAQTSHKGDLDGALKQLDEADKSMIQAEELYINALKLPSENDITAQVQQKQLADRKEISELRKKLEELKKLQKQAQDKTKQAQDKNRQQQQQQQQQQQNQQDKQNKQNKQDKQNQQDKQDKQDKQSAQQALNEAQKAVNDYQKQAENMENKKLQEQAANAADALKDAQKKQSQGDYKGAEKDLEKAREALGKEQKQDRSGKEQQNPEKSPDNKSDNQAGAAQAAEQEKNKMDPKQADALLDSMSQDEKNLRDAIRSNRNMRQMRPVEKDW